MTSKVLDHLRSGTLSRYVGRATVGLAAACLLLGTVAGMSNARAADVESAKPGESPEMCASSALIGRTVRDPENRRLGSINSFLFDKDTGRLRFVVLAPAAGLDRNQMFFALRWSAIRRPLPCGEHAIRTEVRFDQLLAARPMHIQEVQTSGWSEDRSPIWTLKVDVLEPEPSRSVEISDEQLKDLVVNDPDGHAIGSVGRVIIDTQKGRIAYLTVLPLDALTTDIGFVPIPFESVYWSDPDEAFRITLPRTLDTAPRFHPLADLASGTRVDRALLQSLLKAYEGSSQVAQQIAAACPGRRAPTVVR